MRQIILYVGNFDKPEISAAGKRVYNNSVVLEKLGYKIYMIGKIRNSANENHTEINYGKNISYIGFPKYKIIENNKYINFIKEFVAKNRLKPVAIIRYGHPSLALFDHLLTKYAHSINIPIIADIVDWLSVSNRNIFFKIVKSLDTYIDKTIFNKHVDGMIVISSYLDNYYSRIKIPRIIIPPLANSYKLNSMINEYVTITYAGTPFILGKRIKNKKAVKDRLDLAVLAISELIQKGNKVLFNIYGVSKSDFLIAYPDYQNVLLKAEDGIRFWGRKTMQDVQDAISNSDFSIILRERTRETMAGFSTKLVESISCGTPVITTDTSDTLKYVQDGINGFIINIQNKNELERKLREIILLDKEKIREMKLNCFNKKEFLVDKFQIEFLDLFKKLLNDKNRM